MSTVVMTNPKLPGDERSVTTKEAFEEVWSDKGWVLLDEAPADEGAAAKPKRATKPKPTSKPAQAPVTAAQKDEAT